jgi:hypothetical protein
LIAIDDRHLLVGLLVSILLHNHVVVEVVMDNMRAMSNEDVVLLRGTEDQVPFASRIFS